MGLFFRHGTTSKSYCASIDKAFQKIEKECTLIEARKNQRIAHRNNVKTVFWSFMALLTWRSFHVFWEYIALWAMLAVVVRRCALYYLDWTEGCDAHALRKLHESKRKMIKELKESVHFEKTLTLLQKYDPKVHTKASALQAATGMSPLVGTSHILDGSLSCTMARGAAHRRAPLPPYTSPAFQQASAPPQQHLPSSAAQPQQQQQQQPPAVPPPPLSQYPPPQQLTGFAAAAAEAVGATVSVVDRVVNTLVGTDPVMVEELRRSQEEVQMLRAENERLQRQLRRRRPSRSDGPSDQGESGSTDLPIQDSPQYEQHQQDGWDMRQAVAEDEEPEGEAHTWRARGAQHPQHHARLQAAWGAAVVPAVAGATAAHYDWPDGGVRSYVGMRQHAVGTVAPLPTTHGVNGVIQSVVY